MTEETAWPEGVEAAGEFLSSELPLCPLRCLEARLRKISLKTFGEQ